MKRLIGPCSSAALCCGALLASGCTSTVSHVAELPQDTAVMSSHTYDAANRCLSPYIANYLLATNQKLLFLIDDLGDVTKNPIDPSSGPLSFGGGLILTSIMRASTPNDLVILPQARPQSAQLYFAGVNLEQSDLAGFQALYQVTKIFGINGGFTSFDQNRGSNGYGVGGSAGNDEIDVSADFGRSNDGGRANLVLLIGDVATNRTIGTVRLTGTERRRSATFDGTLEIDGFGVGYSRNDVVIDGIHNVQENLMSAAHFYLWSALLPGSDEVDCLFDGTANPAIIATRASVYEDASTREKRRLLQQALNNFHQPAGPLVPEDGVIGERTLKSIRAAERELGLLPHSAGVFGSLYVRLIAERAKPHGALPAAQHDAAAPVSARGDVAALARERRYRSSPSRSRAPLVLPRQ